MTSWHLHKSSADEKWHGLLFLLTLRCLLLSSSSQIRLDMRHGLPPLDQSNYLSHSLREVSTESYCLILIWTQQFYFVQLSISIVLHNIMATISSCTRYNSFESQRNPFYRVLCQCFFKKFPTVPATLQDRGQWFPISSSFQAVSQLICLTLFLIIRKITSVAYVMDFIKLLFQNQKDFLISKMNS